MEQDEMKYLGMTRVELIDAMTRGVRRYMIDYSSSNHPEDLACSMATAAEVMGCAFSELVAQSVK